MKGGEEKRVHNIQQSFNNNHSHFPTDLFLKLQKFVINTDKIEHTQISIFIQQYQQKHTQTTILQMLSGCSFNQPYSSTDQHIETKLTKFTGSTNLPQNNYKRYQGLLVLVSQKTLLSHSCSILYAVSSRRICLHDDSG